jgi:putative tryptophan/tyrosine transport system substrate-binding protein
MSCRSVGCILAFILGLVAAPPETDAQPLAKVATIGYLQVRGAPGSGPFTEAFRQGLHDLGYVEGKTCAIAYRSAEGDLERLPALAAELVRLPVDVIFAASGQVAEAVKDATTTIPIVMVSGADPVAIGLVASLARPGGNMTGLTLMNAELAGKQLQLLKEATGSLGRVAVLWNARDAVMTNIFSEIQTAAPVLGVTVQPLGVQEAKDIDSAIATLTAERPDALFMITDVLTLRYTRQVLDFAARHRLPTMFQSSGPVAEGGLMYYGPSATDSYRRAAYYVDRILKGAKPGDLPVEQPVKFELVVNLKTAKTLGITVPPSLVMLGDRVIE